MLNVKRRLPLYLCLILLVCAQTAFAAAAESPGGSGADAGKLARQMDEILHRTNTPGMVVAVLSPDMARPLVVARGLADVENAAPLRPDAIFRYGSVTKVFTALRIEHCIRAGKLSPDTNVRHYFPKLGGNAPITVRQLLTHTSGLPELLAQPEVLANPAKRWTKAEMLGAINGKPPLFAPGTKQRYNNTGYFLLGLLLDKLDATEEVWLAREREALNMPSLRIADDEAVVPRMAQGYSLGANKELRRPMLFSTSLAYGAGDLEGDAADLLQLTRLLGQSGLRPENPEPLRLPDGSAAVKQKNAAGQHYGWSLLGSVSLFDLGGGRAYVGKSGLFPGYTAQYFYDPQTKTSVVLLINQEKASDEIIKLGFHLLDERRAAATGR